MSWLTTHIIIYTYVRTPTRTHSNSHKCIFTQIRSVGAALHRGVRMRKEERPKQRQSGEVRTPWRRYANTSVTTARDGEISGTSLTYCTASAAAATTTTTSAAASAADENHRQLHRFFVCLRASVRVRRAANHARPIRNSIRFNSGVNLIYI